MKNRVQSICSFRKSVQYWEENFLNFFGLFYRIYFTEPSCYFKQNLLVHSKFKTTKFHCANKYFSPIKRQLLPICMDVAWQNSTQQNIQTSFTRRNIHHINVCSLERDLFLFTMALLLLLLSLLFLYFQLTIYEVTYIYSKNSSVLANLSQLS